MLNNYIGGGKVFLHKIRMLWQVLGKTVHIAVLLGILITTSLHWSKLQKLDLHAFYSYRKAVIADGFDEAMNNIRISVGNKPDHITLVDAKTKSGIWITQIDPRKVIKSYIFKEANRAGINLAKEILISSSIITLSVFIVIVLVWSRFGKAVKEKKHISGSEVKTPKEASRYLRKNKKASNFNIGGVPLVKDSETKHILITGSTGSGKTNCLHTLLPQIRAQKQPAVIVDTEGDMVSRYYRAGYDIIINPYDTRTHNWDLWAEITSNKCIKKIATSFFPDSPPDSYEYDKKWTSWGKMLFIGCLEYLKQQNKMTIENLYNLIHRETIESLTEKLASTSVGSLLASKSDNNVAPHNIRINTILATEWLEFLSDSKEKNFSFKKWFKALDSAPDDRWIFITCDASDSKVLLPFFSVITDIALNSLLSLGINPNRRVWFGFDELAKLKYLPALQENITLLRKYGGCVLAATQSFNQILAHYGRNSGSVMLGQFNTNIIFRISEVEEARIIAKRIGEIEYSSQQQNTSYGDHEFQDGLSYTEQEKKKDLISISDLSNLEVHQAYMLLPEPVVPIVKTKLAIIPKPSKLEPAFLPNPQIEVMLQERAANWARKNKKDNSNLRKSKESTVSGNKGTAKKQPESKKKDTDKVTKIFVKKLET